MEDTPEKSEARSYIARAVEQALESEMGSSLSAGARREVEHFLRRLQPGKDTGRKLPCPVCKRLVGRNGRYFITHKHPRKSGLCFGSSKQFLDYAKEVEQK